MPKREEDESWPYLEQFTPAYAADQQQRLGRLSPLRNMGLRFEKLDKDYSRVSIAPQADPARTRGMLHGGILATLVDTAAAQALRTTLKQDHDAVTIHLDTKYLRPVYDERVSAEGSVVRKGRNLAHIDVQVVNQRGALVARGWCVLKLTRRPEPPPLLPPPAPGCELMAGGLGI